jgi:hypothetical protein
MQDPTITFRKLSAGHYRNDETGVEIVKVPRQRLGRNGYRVAGWSITAPAYSTRSGLSRDEAGFETTLTAAKTPATRIALATRDRIAQVSDEAHREYVTVETSRISGNAKKLGSRGARADIADKLATARLALARGEYRRAASWVGIANAVATHAASLEEESPDPSNVDPKTGHDVASGWHIDGTLTEPQPGDIVRINRTPGAGDTARRTADRGLEWKVTAFAADRNRVQVDLVRGSILGPQWENWGHVELIRRPTTPTHPYAWDATPADVWLRMANDAGFYRAAAQAYFNDVYRTAGSVDATINALHDEARDLDAAREHYATAGGLPVSREERVAGYADWAAMPTAEQDSYVKGFYADMTGDPEVYMHPITGGDEAPPSPTEVAIDVLLRRYNLT